MAHNVREEMRMRAVQCMREGQSPAAAATTSFGMHRSWAYKRRASAAGGGKGLRALRSTKGTGRPRSCAPAQEREVFRWVKETYPAIARKAKRQKAEIFFWNESGFRADSVHGKTCGVKGQTPTVQRPGQRQSISAASAVNSKGAFWFESYQGALTGELFVELLKHMMLKRDKPVHLVIDGLPAHKKAIVKEYVASTASMLTLHFLPDYAPDLNPDELVSSHAKRTGVARNPLRKGEKLRDRD